MAQKILNGTVVCNQHDKVSFQISVHWSLWFNLHTMTWLQMLFDYLTIAMGTENLRHKMFSPFVLTIQIPNTCNCPQWLYRVTKVRPLALMCMNNCKKSWVIAVCLQIINRPNPFKMIIVSIEHSKFTIQHNFWSNIISYSFVCTLRMKHARKRIIFDTRAWSIIS